MRSCFLVNSAGCEIVARLKRTLLMGIRMARLRHADSNLKTLLPKVPTNLRDMIP